MFNEGAEQIFGYGQDEVLGAPLDILIPERMRAIHRRHVDAFAGGSTAARGMGERGRDIVGLRKQGDEFPAEAAISRLDVGGRTVLTVALRDVTERRRLEAEQEFLAEVGPVLASSFAYEETLSKVADLAVRDLADRCIVDLIENGHLRRLKTSTRGAAHLDARDGSLRVGLDGDSDDVLRSVRESRMPLVTGGLVAVPIVAHEELLGTLTLVSWTTQGPHGVAVLRLAVELARRAALAIENGRLYEAAQRATQARDDLLGIVAHDLRNPLNGILMAAGLLRPRGFAERRSQRPGEIIERSAQRMNHLIEDLLEVTRMEAGRLPFEPGSLSPGQVIADAVEAQKPLVTAASLEIQAEVPVQLMDVWADRDRLLQIFENLIGNAVKFTPAHGHVSVGAEQGEDEVTFRVADTGAGIVDAELPHLFDRFWQGDRAKRGGAGLGLPIVKGIVDAHGGRIWVRSAPGRGTTFFFTLPTARKAEPRWPVSP
jgi:PAS domain S-box-containing protein